MLFLYLILISCCICLGNSLFFRRDRLLAFIILLSVIATPIGSNNETMPNLNNLFLAAPFALWMLGKFFRRKLRKTEAFPVMASVKHPQKSAAGRGIHAGKQRAFGKSRLQCVPSSFLLCRHADTPFCAERRRQRPAAPPVSRISYHMRLFLSTCVLPDKNFARKKTEKSL